VIGERWDKQERQAWGWQVCAFGVNN